MLENIEAYDDPMKPHYILTKRILDIYDFQKTKERVEKKIEEYKTAKFKYLVSSQMLEQLSQVFDDNGKQFSNTKADKIGNNLCEKIDAERIIDYYEEIFNSVIKLFSKEELTYYSMCLINNASEQYTASFLNLSVDGLKYIKQNCIIKIALAFHIEVLK